MVYFLAPHRKMMEKPLALPPRRAATQGNLAWVICRLWRGATPAMFQLAVGAALLSVVLGRCNTPPNLHFASPINELNQTDFAVGTVLSYKCRPGYYRVNSKQQLTCTSRGQWNYLNFCSKKKCRNPGELPNGQVIVKSDLSFGSEIEFSCSEGFLLQGPTTSSCEVQDNTVDWSNTFPQCIIAKCEPPPKIPLGTHSGDKEDEYTYGSSVTYRCQPGFSLVGKASISCSVQNKTLSVWHPKPPECKKVSCPALKVANGSVISGFGPTYTYKDSIVFNCNKGFDLRGSRVIHCGADNSWNPPPPICELNSCIGVPTIANAERFSKEGYLVRTDDVFKAGTELKYSCRQGFRPEAGGKTEVLCHRNLTWSPHTKCEEICCPTPELKNGKITQERSSGVSCRYLAGDRISYTCFEKHMSLARCQWDGTWAPEMPTCDIQSCYFPPKIAHGHHREASLEDSWTTLMKKSIIYECDPGYTLEGKALLTCSNSHWPEVLPTCRAQCLKPYIAHGSLSPMKSKYLEPEEATVYCAAGYRLVGSQRISCSENRTWSPELPRCEWVVPAGCEHVIAGQKLMQCLPEPGDVRLALDVYKLSLEIRKLEREVGTELATYIDPEGLEPEPLEPTITKFES